MCCEDVRIDYSKVASEKLLALTTSSQQLFAPDVHRWSIVVGQVSSGTAWLVPDQIAVVGNGLALSTVQAPLILTREMVGSLIGKAWYIIHSVGGVNIFATETLLLPSNPCGDPNHA